MPTTTTKTKLFMILSPAKTMDLQSALPAAASQLQLTTPDCSPDQTQQVATAMKKLSKNALQTKLKISDTLAASARDYWNDFGDNETSNTAARPCIFTYSGAAYQGLQAGTSCTTTTEALVYMQERLRILSAAYGILRPLDKIQPYRLEMGTKGIVTDGNEKLSQFWSASVTASLRREMMAAADDSSSTAILLNLASDEYAETIDVAQLPSVPVKIVFRENGRVIAVHAKRARGLMVRYLATEQIDTLDGVRRFDWEGYSYQESEEANTIVFDREKQTAKKEETEPKKKRTRTR